MFQRTLNGADMINATSLNLPPNENAVRINGDFGTAGQVLAKDSNNKLNWSRVDEVEIPDNSISGAKLKDDITISTTGDIQAVNITATNILKTNTTLDLPFTTSALNITGGGGNGSAGQVLVKDGDNKLAWDFVDDIEIPDRSITHTKLVEKTITAAEIADDAIITRTILDGNITTAKIADDAITTIKILDANITTPKIADEAIINDKIKAGTIENDRIKNLTIENGKIKGGTIAGDKLKSDIAISTSGNIQGATITATDHFVQTSAGGGAVNNTFTGGISISGGAFTQTSANDNTFAGKLDLTIAGNVSAPVQYASGGFALQVGTDAINSDVYISRNLIVDGLIRGDIVGDVSDTHIQTQSLIVKELLAGGTTGITVKDNFDIILMDNNAGSEQIRISLDSSAGTINLADAGGTTSIVINGTNGDITLNQGDYILNSQYGVFKGYDNAGQKSLIKDVDFKDITNTNLAGRTFTKNWTPQLSGSLQVNWTYSASIVPSQNWHDASGEDVYGGSRGHLDLTNIVIRSSKVKGRIRMNMACNYQLGIRLKYRVGAGSWQNSEGYLCLGDDWTDTDSPEYLGRKTWTWETPVVSTTPGATMSFRPEFFIMYNTAYGSTLSRVQFWVGSSTGNDAPGELQNADLPACFEIIEQPAELTYNSTSPGTYPVGSP
tara:strand:+ start:1877 stop:3880 length:2004 start_codon:yes stop_codon:yes gene_type:complete